MKKYRPNGRELIFALVIIVATLTLAFLPTTGQYKQTGNNREVRCAVLKTENSHVFQHGIFRQGEQWVEVKILDGPDQGKTIQAMNLLQGAVEIEWFYKPGEKAIVGYSLAGEEIAGARMVEPLREGPMYGIFALFFLTLLVLAGWVGVKAVISFAFVIMAIWKILLPVSLEGKFDPILLAIIIVAVLSFVVIFLVAGFNKKGWSAFLGAFGGCAITWVVLLFFGGSMKINGAVSGFAATLRASGFEYLDLLKLFYAAVILSASGAIMDISMDIAASLYEIKEKRPDIGRWELIRSGFNIGRAVIGTMSTTLLLAYSGGAFTMLMYLLARGISIWRIFNMNYVASEMLKTLSGTIGLTMAVPLTAVISGFILVPLLEKSHSSEKRREALAEAGAAEET